MKLSLIRLLFIVFGIVQTAFAGIKDCSVFYLQDTSAKLGIESIAKTPFDTKIPAQFSLGYPSGNSWFKITLHNDAESKDERYILHFTETFFSKFNFFRDTKDGWIEEKNGFEIPLKDRQIEESGPSFYINIKADERQTYYVQANSKYPRFGAFEIYTPTQFLKHTKVDLTLYMLYFGGMIVVILLNTFLFLTLKERLYGYYAGYVFFTAVWVFVSSGGWHLYTPFSPYSDILQTSAALFMIFLVLFSSTFLDIKSFLPKIYKLFQITIFLLIILAVLINIDFHPWYHYLSVVGTINFSLLAYASIVIWKKGSSQAGIYFFGIAIYIISIAFFSAMVNGWLENNNTIRYGFLFASAIEITLFSLIIANRFNLTQKETIKLQDTLLKVKTRSTQELERIVQERSMEILEKNRELERLAVDRFNYMQSSMHEIKTPLSIITLNNELRSLDFGDDDYSQEIDSALKILQNSYEDMNFTMNQDKITYPTQILDLAKVLKERVHYFDVIAKSKSKTLTLAINSEHQIEISFEELTRLIDNNLSNAIKYSEMNSTISVVLEDNVLSFHNLGEPIKDTEQIFDKYFRENNVVGGHGLGLSIVKGIAKKYGIAIELISNSYNGSTFTYRL